MKAFTAMFAWSRSRSLAVTLPFVLDQCRHRVAVEAALGKPGQVGAIHHHDDVVRRHAVGKQGRQG